MTLYTKYLYLQIICICTFLHKEGDPKELCAVSTQKILQENILNPSCPLPQAIPMVMESLGVHRSQLSVRTEDGSLDEDALRHQGIRVEPVSLEYLSISKSQSCHQ